MVRAGMEPMKTPNTMGLVGICWDGLGPPSRTFNPKVVGSIPTGPTEDEPLLAGFGASPAGEAMVSTPKVSTFCPHEW